SIIEAIITILKTFNISFALAAPTGKAAKRMEEKTGEAAMTLHRLLNIAPIDGADFFESSEEIEADFIIVDEVSM
ncbi:MAG: AAA family ATPase, partial [Fenollaria timonensis]